METKTKIWYDHCFQVADIKYTVAYGKPQILRVSIKGKNITDEVGPMSRAKIKIAILEHYLRRVEA